MQCSACVSNRVAEVSAKCSDMFSAFLNKKEFSGYVPKDLGIGSGNYVEFSYCLDCGQIQGKFPLSTSELEKE